MTDKPHVAKAKSVKSQNKAMIKAALDAAKGSKAKFLFVYIDAVEEELLPLTFPNGLELVFVSKKKDRSWSGKTPVKEIITLPYLPLGRMGMMKIAVIFALSTKLATPADSIVFLGGKAEHGILDFLITFQIDRESEIIGGTNFTNVTDTVNPAVFEHTLNMAVELASKGREGKPVGTIFVLGDEEKVMQLSKQMIINPFKGYDEAERNLLNPNLKDTIVEFAGLDGAFVISGEGEVLAAGRYLGAATDESDMPRGLGARHIAAAGITALTKAITIVISESSGDVRIFRNGKVVLNIEKASR